MRTIPSRRLALLVPLTIAATCCLGAAAAAAGGIEYNSVATARPALPIDNPDPNDPDPDPELPIANPDPNDPDPDPDFPITDPDPNDPDPDPDFPITNPDPNDPDPDPDFPITNPDPDADDPDAEADESATGAQVPAQLPQTGAESLAVSIAGIVLVGGGAVTLALTRRRTA